MISNRHQSSSPEADDGAAWENLAPDFVVLLTSSHRNASSWHASECCCRGFILA